MNSPILLLAIYCLLVVAASMTGGWLPMLVHLTHKRMQLAVSVVAGFMLGIAMLHMLPHALESGGSPYTLLQWAMAGLLTMFFIERFFCFHHHDVPEARAIEAAAQGDPPPQNEESRSHACTHDHDHTHQHGHDAQKHSAHRLTWSGAAMGLTLHSVIGGVALAAAVAAETAHGGDSRLPGLGVFLVIFLHKPFDSMSLITLMSVGGWSFPARHLVNALYATCTALGVALFYAGYGQFAGESSAVIGPALAFSAGTFLCISLSDLLPELQFHQHDRGKLSTALLTGLALAWVIHLVEGRTHDHDHGHAGHTDAVPAQVDDHAGHDHSGHDHDHDH